MSRRTVWALALLAGTATATDPQPVPQEMEQPALILAVSGRGTLKAPGADPVGLVEGALIPPGTQVCTAADSFATVRLASAPGCGDEDDLTLLPGTCLIVTDNRSRSGSRDSVLDMQSGGISVREGDGRGAVLVRTPSGATSGAQGGFRVAIEDDAMRSEAVTRPVTVSGGGVERPVQAGFGTRTPTGGAPTDPVALLPPGAPTTPPPDARLHVPDFAWRPVNRALGYRIEIASDPFFTRLLRRSEVSRPAYEPTTLFLPYRVDELYWRVVAFDRLGFDGIPSEGRRLRFPRGIASEASD